MKIADCGLWIADFYVWDKQSEISNPKSEMT